MKTSVNMQPVTYSAVVSSVNVDRSPLLSEIVPVHIFGLRLLLDLPRQSPTARNLVRAGECVINLPDAETTAAIERLAHAVGAIGSNVDLNFSQAMVGGRFERAHMTLVPSESVSALRALECPIQIEAKVVNDTCDMTDEHIVPFSKSQTFWLDVLRVHIDPSVVDSDVRWTPFMTCLREAYLTSPTADSSVD